MVNFSSGYISIGKFGRAFGVLGWIKVVSFTSPIEKILSYQPWYIKNNKNIIESYFEYSKFFKNGNILVKFANYNSPEEVSYISGFEIGTNRSKLSILPIGDYYWCDLQGLTVINSRGIILGIVKELIITGANDVLVVVGESGRNLIPYLSSTIINVDLINGIIQVEW